MSNSAIEARRAAAVSRGVGVATQIYADRAENAELWDAEGKRLVFGSDAGDCGVIDIGA